MDTAPSSAEIPDPRRIRAARDLRTYTQGEVVGRMRHPISAAALSQIEAGKTRPSRETLAELSHALDVPLEFLQTRWSGGQLAGDDAPTFFRDLRSTPARERRRAAALAQLLQELLSVVAQYVRLPRFDVPNVELGVDPSRSEIEAAAMAVRREWELGDEPVVHVVREIERHGVPVARLTFGTRQVDAFSVAGDRPVILLAEDKGSYVRSRFDAAHELGHLVLHRNAEPGTREVEQQAHNFASSLLLPEAVARDVLPSRLDGSAWGQLASLKLEWGMSMAALLLRSRDLRILSADAHRNAMKYMSAKGWRSAEPGDREMGPPEAPLLIERVLRTIEVKEGISVEELVRGAALPLDDTLQLVRAAVDPRPIIEL